MKEKYSPRWAPHVRGEFDREVDEDGRPEPTWVHLSCEKCGATHLVRCDSGAPIHWVQKFATSHLHRDVMKDPVPGEEKKR